MNASMGTVHKRRHLYWEGGSVRPGRSWFRWHTEFDQRFQWVTSVILTFHCFLHLSIWQVGLYDAGDNRKCGTVHVNSSYTCVADSRPYYKSYRERNGNHVQMNIAVTYRQIRDTRPAKVYSVYWYCYCCSCCYCDTYEEDIIEQCWANESNVHIVQSIRELSADFLQTKFISRLFAAYKSRLIVLYYQLNNNNNKKIIHSQFHRRIVFGASETGCERVACRESKLPDSAGTSQLVTQPSSPTMQEAGCCVRIRDRKLTIVAIVRFPRIYVRLWNFLRVFTLKTLYTHARSSSMCSLDVYVNIFSGINRLLSKFSIISLYRSTNFG